MSAERALNVFINTAHVAIVFENNGLWRLSYQQSWLAAQDAYPLAPSLPLQEHALIDTGSQRPVQWFFDNLLPEEGARELLAREARVDVEDAFSLLELIGAESAGAITLLAPEQSLGAPKLGLLTTEELSERIQNLPRSPLNQRSRKRMSLAGAQHKMLIVLDGEVMYEPIGSMPSTHILKPEHQQPELYPFTVRNEHFVMSLAKRCDLSVPKVTTRYVPQACYIVERFDREGVGATLSRVHTLDACQLLGIAAYRKYTASQVSALRRLVELCRAKAATALQLYRWIVFNFLVGNGDAHLKNLSFRFEGKAIRLLPHYDLLCTVIYEKQGEHGYAELSQPLGRAKRFEEVRRADLIDAAAELGLPAVIATRELDKLIDKVTTQGGQLLETFDQLPPYASKAGELRMLRQIFYLAITEFSQQVKI